jgi:hypothetical protein
VVLIPEEELFEAAMAAEHLRNDELEELELRMRISELADILRERATRL